MVPSAVLVPGGGLDISLYSSGAECPPYEIVWSKTSAAEAGSHSIHKLKQMPFSSHILHSL